MAICKKIAATDCFSFVTSLHGFHAYHHTVSRNPYIEQEISFKRELNNTCDKCAICGKAILPGQIAPVVIGHVTKELSSHIWFTIQKGVKPSAFLENAKAQSSPLLQGGLEVLINMKIEWYKDKNIQILKEKVSNINFKHYEVAS